MSHNHVTEKKKNKGTTKILVAKGKKGDSAEVGMEEKQGRDNKPKSP